MDEPGKRQLCGARAATGRVGGLVDADAKARPGERDCGREPIGTGAHDDRIG